MRSKGVSTWSARSVRIALGLVSFALVVAAQETLISPQQARPCRLKSSLKGLRVAAEPSWPLTGWRGFLVVNNGLRELPEEIRAFRGTIRIQSGNRVRYYHDTRELKRWLDSEARSRGIAIP